MAIRWTALSAVAAVLGAATASAQPDPAKVQVKLEKAAEGVYMLAGAGGNIGVSAGADALFLVDDQYAPLTPKILEALKTLSDKAPRFVVNTHWHGDHSGGNENMGKAGALLIAHENVRGRMSVEQFIEALNRREPPSAPAALPVVTFTDAVTFHLNGDVIHAFHVPPAHTDGDSIVHFKKANVIHAGDLFFNGFYPFIDTSSGGSLVGVIAAADRMLGLANDQTKIIPGHGPMATRADLQRYRDVLVAVRDRVGALVNAGKTLDEVKAARPLAEFDEKWGTGFMKPDIFLTIVYKSLSSAAAAKPPR